MQQSHFRQQRHANTQKQVKQQKSTHSLSFEQ